MYGVRVIVCGKKKKTGSGVGQETQYPDAETSLKTPVQLAVALAHGRWRELSQDRGRSSEGFRLWEEGIECCEYMD